uniref:Retrotransposon Copia-like N-terminal domain-containing protein n=1 Tax=Ananas comosus var. bracteatus TaxID=296719 RepID=A0A6V7PMH9_ANACO|nr:unnamed protein product [Ananas comosus var. bracteatus]
MASLANPKFPFPSTINVANFVTLKLNDNNYLLWETQVVSLIESQDLLGFLMGETIAPPKMSTSESGATVNNPDYTSWVRTDRLVKSWIVGTLSEEVLGHAVGLQTAAEVWTALTNHFKQSSIAREFDLLAQLQHIRKGNNPLPTYLRNFKSICDQLHAIGKPVSDSTKVFRLLEGLDESYEPFKTTMFRPPIPLYTEVVPQLQSYELRIKRHSSPAPDVSMAFVSQRGRGSNRHRGRGRGHNFNSRGRGFPQTTQGGRSEGYQSTPPPGADRAALTSSTGNNPLTCQICKKRGHDALRCWFRFDNSYQSDDIPRGLASLHITDVHDDEWHPDTGANAHITDKPDRCYFYRGSLALGLHSRLY